MFYERRPVSACGASDDLRAQKELALDDGVDVSPNHPCRVVRLLLVNEPLRSTGQQAIADCWVLYGTTRRFVEYAPPDAPPRLIRGERRAGNRTRVIAVTEEGGDEPGTAKPCKHDAEQTPVRASRSLALACVTRRRPKPSTDVIACHTSSSATRFSSEAVVCGVRSPSPGPLLLGHAQPITRKCHANILKRGPPARRVGELAVH